MHKDQVEKLDALVAELKISEGQLLTMAGEIAETSNIRGLADLRDWQVGRLIDSFASVQRKPRKIMLVDGVPVKPFAIK